MLTVIPMLCACKYKSTYLCMSKWFDQDEMCAKQERVLRCEQKAAGWRIWREILTGDPHKSLAELLDSDKPV